MFQRKRFGDLFSPEFAGSVSPSYGFLQGRAGSHGRMMDIKTVNHSDVASAASKKTRKGEEPQGLRPEVIGRKVVDPGVD